MSMGENERLSDEQLRQKTVVLLRLDLMSRSSDLAKLFRSQIVWGEASFKVRFYKPKEWRPEAKSSHGVWSGWVTVHKYDKYPSICTYRVLREYISRTESTGVVIEGVSVDGIHTPQIPLFISISPKGGKYYGLKSGTLSSIALSLMKLAFIPSRFGAKSIRGAVASCALDYGAKERDVLSQARWSDAKLFRKYYYRKIDRSPRLQVVSRASDLAFIIRASL
jgi:hypothetical protein